MRRPAAGRPAPSKTPRRPPSAPCWRGDPRLPFRSRRPGSASIEPLGEQGPRGAGLLAEVKPLIDELLERHVALNPIGLLGEVEGLVRVDGAEHARMLLLLKTRLGRVRHH